MTIIPQNRMAEPQARGRGRPSNSEVSDRQPAVEAQMVVVPDNVLPCICPKCGRGMQPRVIRKRPDGVRDCTCALCGKEFEYTPATIRPKG